MQTFYVIIKKNNLVVYEKDGNSYKKVFLEGEPEYYYNVNSAKDYIDKFLEVVASEYNLDTIGEVDFILIDNEDTIVSKAVTGAFGEFVKRIINIEELITGISSSIGRDKKLHISEYGINYDGKKYVVKNGKMEKEDFNLLAYSIKDDMIMKFIV